MSNFFLHNFKLSSIEFICILNFMLILYLLYRDSTRKELFVDVPADAATTAAAQLGASGITVPGSLQVDGPLNVKSRYIDLGVSHVGREINAGKIVYGDPWNCLVIAGKGTNYGNREIGLWDNVIVHKNLEVVGDTPANADGSPQGLITCNGITVKGGLNLPKDLRFNVDKRDDWIRLVKTSTTVNDNGNDDYIGGFAAKKLWCAHGDGEFYGPGGVVFKKDSATFGTGLTLPNDFKFSADSDGWLRLLKPSTGGYRGLAVNKLWCEEGIEGPGNILKINSALKIGKWTIKEVDGNLTITKDGAGGNVIINGVIKG